MRVSGIQAYNQYNVQQNRAQVQNNKNVSFGLMSDETRRCIFEHSRENTVEDVDYLQKTPMVNLVANEDKDAVIAYINMDYVRKNPKGYLFDTLIHNAEMLAWYFHENMQWQGIEELVHLCKNIVKAGPNTSTEEIYSDYYHRDERPEYVSGSSMDNSPRRTTALEDLKDNPWF